MGQSRSLIKSVRALAAGVQTHIARKDPAHTDESEFLSVLRNVIFFVAAYLYFAGWVYSYYLYYQFGVSLNSLDISFYNFFIYSYAVFGGNKLLVMIVGTGFVAAVIALRRHGEIKKWIVIIFLIGLVPTLFHLSKERGGAAALLLRQGYAVRPVSFAFRDEKVAGYPAEMLVANRSNQLWLLTQTKDKFYVFLQPEREGNELPKCITFIVDSKDVYFISIKGPNVSNRDVGIENVPR